MIDGMESFLGVLSYSFIGVFGDDLSHKHSLATIVGFLFSAHIPYRKGKYSNQILQNLPSTEFIFKFKDVSHRIQLT